MKVKLVCILRLW